MNLNENLKMVGELTVVKRGRDGQVKQSFKVPNLVVTSGKEFIAESMLKTTTNLPTAMSHMAIGTSTATPVIANITLGTEVGRVELASSSSTNNQVTYTATFPAGTGTGAITEAGILNAASNGTMLCRTTFPVVTKEAGDSIAITWIVTVS
jgi:hypothetical protein